MKYQHFYSHLKNNKRDSMGENEGKIKINLKKYHQKGISKRHSSGLYYKCFTLVIYDRNDIGLYYKTRDNRN